MAGGGGRVLFAQTRCSPAAGMRGGVPLSNSPPVRGQSPPTPPLAPTTLTLHSRQVAWTLGRPGQHACAGPCTRLAAPVDAGRTTARRVTRPSPSRLVPRTLRAGATTGGRGTAPSAPACARPILEGEQDAGQPASHSTLHKRPDPRGAPPGRKTTRCSSESRARHSDRGHTGCTKKDADPKAGAQTHAVTTALIDNDFL